MFQYQMKVSEYLTTRENLRSFNNKIGLVFFGITKILSIIITLTEASYRLDPTMMLFWCSGQVLPQTVPAIRPLKIRTNLQFSKQKICQTHLTFPPKTILVLSSTTIPRLFISLRKFIVS